MPKFKSGDDLPFIFDPTDFSMFGGLQVPDPITFVLGRQWLAQPRLYPRQGTLLKVIFLRDDLFTDYDNKVIDEWEATFTENGHHGISPGIRQRILINKQNKRKWFREVLLVMGRRAGKGHVCGLAMAYVLWNYMALGDPQEHFGIAASKKMECLIYAGKKEQARKNLYGDLVSAISDGPCFAPWINRTMVDSMSIYAPADKFKIAERAKRGVDRNDDQATFLLTPREATMMSGRGGASFIIGFDEMAHVVASGANRSAEEIYGAATPSLDQFRPMDFIVEPSSPYQQTGQFYQNYEMSVALNEGGEPEFPSMFMLQLTSWDPYKDWERAHEIAAFPEGFQGDLGEYEDAELPRYPRLDRAFQEYDEEMRRLKVSNPETFRVEREADWAATMDAYLDPDKVEAMFDDDLKMTKIGKLHLFYKAHADPSSTNANFGFAVAHTEDHPDQPGFKICVFDYIHHWDPADFSDHTIDYVKVIDEIWEVIKGFPVDEFTTDQFYSGAIKSLLQEKINKYGRNMPKTPQLGEVTATAKLNWKKAENFKVALNQGWIKAPYYEQADKELKFLRLVQTATTQRVDKQETGPVVTKDVADAMFECVHALLGAQIEAMIAGLTKPLAGAVQGGITPFSSVSDHDAAIFRMMGPGGGAARLSNGFGGMVDPARGVRRGRDGRPVKTGW